MPRDSIPVDEASVPQKFGTMLDVSSLRQIVEVTGRSCRLCKSGVTGSGFLIGPDLIMTAYHVVERLMRVMDPGDDRVLIEFYVATGGPGRMDEIRLGSNEIVAFDAELDYAIIRLPRKYGYHRYDESASRMRGWHSLNRSKQRLLDFERPLALLHFPQVKRDNILLRDVKPDKSRFVVSGGAVSKKVGDRFYHSAATEEGSSGGLCFISHSLIPLALHVQTKGDDNIAVEMAAILEHVELNFSHIDKELMSNKPESLCPRISWDGKPILNRDGIIAKAMGMIHEADRHPLYVYGHSRSGRTFIKEIVKTFRPSRLHEHIEVSTLGKNKKIIREITRRIFNSEERVRHFDDSETFHSYFKREIGKVLNELDQVCSLQHDVAFVFFDGFDVADELALDLFSHVCGLAPQFTHIRIALSGSIEVPTGVNAHRLELGAIKPDDFSRLAEHFCCYHELGIEQFLVAAAVQSVLSTIDFNASTLVTHANRAHDLCNSLRDLSEV